MPKRKILIIDDDVDICTLLKRFLESNDYDVETAFNGTSGIKKLKDQTFDIALTDFRLPDIGGIELIKSIKSLRSETQVIVITGYSDVKQAINCIKNGAFEYVTKPIQPEEILLTIKNAITRFSEKKELQSDSSSKTNKSSKKKTNSKGSYVIGSSETSKSLDDNINLIAPTDMSVIILGETGTGKEVAAKRIHERSARKNNIFVAVDCGALPTELASSELFGHVKGSFTGAIADKKGSFEMAHGGTLFLDEIGNLTYENQIKLLRVLQERQIRKVGDTKDIDIDVRVIVATNEDLKTAVRENSFREDLYYRLNEFNIQLAPLRERKGDLMQFANHFLEEANQQLKKEVKGFNPDVVNKLTNYFWHGNLRELKNVVKRATLLTTEDKIQTSALPQEIIHPSFITNEHKSEAEAFEITDLKSVAERAEKKAIEEVLNKTGFNKTKTAEILKIDRKTLYNKMTSYGIEL